MTRRRWIADEVEGERAALTGAHAAHLSKVLRVQTGQEFDVACGQIVRRGTVTSVSDDGFSACTNRMRQGFRPLAVASAT